ncbi:MAG: phosphonate ABC transporter, permease protein PhnE [Candidatus Hydrogenedentota bacterium]|nr:MAG: phosphonate ABC transporter, permease protein PhnE [Candidatus Hydrogenedentota bacterium]
MTPLQQRWLNRKGLHALIAAVLLAVVVWAFMRSEFNLVNLRESGPNILEFLTRLVPPDWSVTELVIKATIETLTIALCGTFIAVIVSLPLGFLAASNITPAWISFPVKTILGFIRSIPIIVIAVLFVAAVGLGPFPGVLAVALHSIGMLAKFYAEEFETADKDIVQAVKGTGASWLQTLQYGLFTQSKPQIVAFTIYRLEMNFRDATVLGIVGAGGIGTYILMYTQSFQYDRVAVLLVVIGVVVFLLDQISFWVRKWVG